MATSLFTACMWISTYAFSTFVTFYRRSKIRGLTSYQRNVKGIAVEMFLRFYQNMCTRRSTIESVCSAIFVSSRKHCVISLLHIVKRWPMKRVSSCFPSSGTGNNLKIGGTRRGSTTTNIRLGERFRDGQYSLSVSWSLFFYSRGTPVSSHL